MRITAKFYACIGAAIAIMLMTPSISFAAPLDPSVVYDLHVVSADLDVGWQYAAEQRQVEKKSSLPSAGSGSVGRSMIGVSYTIKNITRPHKTLVSLGMPHARGPPLRI